MFILENYRNTWDYTFIAFALFAIGIGTFITIKKMKKDEIKKRHELRSDNENEKDNTSH